MVGCTASRSMTRTIAPFAFCTVSSWSTTSSNGRDSSSTYWNIKKAVPTVITPRCTSTALLTKATTEPPATAPCTAHHMRKNALSRRTELAIASALSSTKRHIACWPAPLARRSSAAVSRSSIPPYSRAYEPISSDDSPTARCRPRTTAAMEMSVYTAVPAARRQSTAVSTMIMPTIISVAPTARGTTRPRKSDTEVTSPSTR